ncbi:unnamed protein product [Sphagnum balticum]
MAIFTDNLLGLVLLTLACLLKLSIALLMPELGNYGASHKSEWPELLFKPKFEAALAIQDPFAGYDPTQSSVFFQSPFEADVHVAPKYANDKDVWIYTTASNDGIVYEIPRRGQWHPNRIDPGWTNLVGVDYKMAIQIIKQDMPGVLVEYKPADRLPPNNIRINRVILYINPDGNVDRTPKVG